ncbi:MAG: hypothetical protein K8R76_01005 [Candidatus Aegiribacteria sp.]|nr:hypothetical protein [Candidatus Aegiribacteria sp.]
MKVTNIHKRIINQPEENISKILDTLSSNNDLLWPKEKWPPMVFKKGLVEGATGGHRPIRYSIKKYVPGNLIEFDFMKPDGFKGIHKFEITEIEKDKTELKHTISMTLSGKGMLTWYFAIKWLHDALLEDCMDKAENNFLTEKMHSDWNLWVLFLRRIFRRKK